VQKIFFVLLTIFVSKCSLSAQTPYRWTFAAKKIAERTYEIHCRIDVNAPWHTYSQTTPDGGPLPTKFIFARNPLFVLDGTVIENGKLLIKHEAVFGVDVKYFDGQVDFVQKVTLRGAVKTNFSGSVEFMVCNDQQCLPPTTQKFTVVIN
jgi:hypothetical protein